MRSYLLLPILGLISVNITAGPDLKSVFPATKTTASPANFLFTPVNDLCAGAIPLTQDDILEGDNSFTVSDGPLMPCGSPSETPKDLWYSFVSNGGETYISTLSGGTLSDTRIALYGGCGGELIACNDDYINNFSLLYFGCGELTPGTTYYIQVAGFGSMTGSFRIRYSEYGSAGCTDFYACNYDPAATCNYGCIYNNSIDTFWSNIALEVNGTVVNGDNFSTCSDGPEMNCGGSNPKDVWYGFTSNGGDVEIIVTPGTIIDSRIAIYDYSGILLGNALACNDDYGGLGSRIAFSCGELQKGEYYYIQVAGFNSMVGTFQISVTEYSQSGCTDISACNYDAEALCDDGSCIYFAPFNDIRNDAYQITPDGIPVFASNISTCSDYIMPCGGAGTLPRDLWYYFYSNGGTLSIETSAITLYDTRIAIYEGDSQVALACDDDSGVGALSKLEFDCGELIAGQFYFIQVAGFSDETGNFELIVNQGPTPGCTDFFACNYAPSATCDDGSCLYGPNNDHYWYAITLQDEIPIPGDNSASCSEGPQMLCGGNLQQKDVWYSFYSDGSEVTLSTSLGTLTDTRMAVYDQGLNPVACNDDYLGFSSLIYFACGELQPNFYYVQVAGYQQQTGSFEITMDVANNAGCTNPGACNYDPTASCDNGTCNLSPPANDVCGTAISVPTDGTIINVVNSNTCIDEKEMNCGGGNYAKDVWYSFVANGGSVDIITGGDLSDTRLALYDDCNSDALYCVDDTPESGYASINLQCGELTPGIVYYIQAAGFGQFAGSFTLSVNQSGEPGCGNPYACNYNPNAGCFTEDLCIIPSSNDKCVNAIYLLTNGTPFTADNSFTCSDQPMSCGGFTTPKDIWFAFLANGGNITIETSPGTLSDTRIELYDSCDGISIACDDDNGMGYASRLDFPCGSLTPGKIYYIQAAGFFSSSGTFQISVTQESVGCTDPDACNYDPLVICDSGNCQYSAVENDICSLATSIVADGTHYPASNENTCANGPAMTCGSNQTPNDVWFSFISNGGEAEIRTYAGTLTDTRIALYEGCEGNLIYCNDDYNGLTSRIYVPCGTLILGNTYYIQASGWSAAQTGTFEISVNQGINPQCGDANALNFNPIATCTHESTCLYAGCTDPIAGNYNPDADYDDGSCTYIDGCTYPDATNYNPAATKEDGSCLFESGNNACPADIDDNGLVNTNDLLALLSAFGSVCP